MRIFLAGVGFTMNLAAVWMAFQPSPWLHWPGWVTLALVITRAELLQRAVNP